MVIRKKKREVLGIVPARGGSKGVPGKNIRLLGGKPLIAWTIESALKSDSITRLVVSTDDKKIADIAESFGAEIPFMRPAELAKDNSPTIDAIYHAVDYLRSKEQYLPDAVMILQPTAPFRKIEDLDESVRIFFEKGADCVVSVSKVPSHFSPDWQLVILNDELKLYNGKEVSSIIKRRQDLQETYWRNGEIYTISPDVIIKQKSLYGEKVFPVLTRGLVNIDTLQDFKNAEKILQEGIYG